MYSHQPDDYLCPFCALASGGAAPAGINRADDVVRRDDLATAFIAPRWWPRNHGHVLVIPNAHHENIYDLSPRYGHAVHDLVRDIAVAIRQTYGCDGTSVRQHNEPAGDQHVWHHHVHVFPRYTGDELYLTRAQPDLAAPDQRRGYADRLRRHFRSGGAAHG